MTDPNTVKPGVAAFREVASDPQCWWRLPLKIRQRWWKETDFGRKPPGDELRQIIQDALQPKPAGGEETDAGPAA